MNKIFLVSQGSYSDYGIVAVFSKQEDADALVEVMNATGTGYDPADVEERPLDCLMVRDGSRLFRVESKQNTIEVDLVESSTYWNGFRGGNDPVMRIGAHKQRITKPGSYLLVTVLARDAQHAIKIAADKFREFVALEGKS